MHPTSERLLAAYRELAENGEISFGIGDRQIAALDSIVKTVEASYFGYEPYPTPEEKAAAYFFYIVEGHAMPDGNKRLAVLWIVVYCTLNEIESDFSLFSWDEIAVSVAKLAQEKTMAPRSIIGLIGHLAFPALRKKKGGALYPKR